MVERGGEMKGIASAKSECMMVHELRRRAEVAALDPQHSEAFAHQPVEHRVGRRALLRADLPRAQLDRHGRRHFGDGPVADKELLGVLLRHPSLDG